MLLTEYYKKLIFQLTPEKLHSEEELENIFRLLRENWHQIPFSHSIQMDKELTASESWLWEEALFKLSHDEPVQHILGHAWFCNQKFKVNQHTLIPRPETEELVQLIKKEETGNTKSFWDIGTGTGCIALSLAPHFHQAKVIATDISEEALEVAKFNHRTLLPAHLNVYILKHDILQQEAFNAEIWASNPPYIEPAEAEHMSARVKEYEPHLALFTPKNDPLIFYRTIIEKFKSMPSAKRLWFEINPFFADQMKREVLAGLDFQFYPYFETNERFLKISKKP